MKFKNGLCTYPLLFCLCSFIVPSVTGAAEQISLHQAVAMALSYNPRIDVAREQCLQGLGSFTQAKSGYLPQVSASGQYGQQWVKNLTPSEDDTLGYASLSLSQLIYDFGRTTGAIDASRFSLEAAEANLHQYIQDVVLSLRTAFYDVLEKQRLVTVAEEAINNYEQHLYRAKRYFDAGVRTRIDVTNAQVNLSNARLDKLRADSDLKASRVVFENVLGIRPDNGNYILEAGHARLEDLAEEKPQIDRSLDIMLATALENRADMRQVHLLTEAAQSAITRAKGGYFPSIKAVGSYETYETDLSESSFPDQWNVSVGLTWELFSGFKTEGEVVESKARYRELMASLRELQLAVVEEVTESYLRADENRQGVDLADEVLELAKENLELAEGRYKAGLNDMIEFNDAQLSLTEAQSTLVTTYYEYLTSLARIERAVGVTDGLAVKENETGQCRIMQWAAK